MAPGWKIGTTVLLSSHLLADLERACDYLIVLQAAGTPRSPATGWPRSAPHAGAMAGGGQRDGAGGRRPLRR
jgi:hypothetical protein